MTEVTLTVNGKKYTQVVFDHLLLADFIREKLKLTGTHIGCDTSQCGCLLYTSPSPRDRTRSRMPSSA